MTSTVAIAEAKRLLERAALCAEGSRERLNNIVAVNDFVDQAWTAAIEEQGERTEGT
jgi:hypothetical protein